MSVSRRVVGGFGFVVTEEEIDRYLESVGSPSDYAPYDDFFVYVRNKFPELAAELVGNQMKDPGLAVLVCAKSTKVENDDVREEEPGFGMYETQPPGKHVPEWATLLELRATMLGSEAPERFLGYQHGILVL